MESDDSWKKFVEEAMEKGAGKAHRWANKPNLPVLGVPCTKERAVDAQSIVDEQSKIWASLWWADNEVAAEKYAAVILQMQQEALATRIKDPGKWDL